MVHEGAGERDVLVGRWHVDQAIGVISALEDAGIRPRAERTGVHVEVFVRNDERQRAHRVLTPAPPDARAGGRAEDGGGRPERASPDARAGGRAEDGGGRPQRASPDPRSGWARDDEQGRPLLAERMRRLARPLGLLLAVLIAITLSYQGPVIGAIAVAIAVGAVAVWLRNRVRDGDDDRWYGG